MNFLVYSSDGRCSVRPDSSRCKDNGDYFVPDDINSLGFTPVVYARMSQSGKAIGKSFVRRYYDAIGFGLLLYPGGQTIYDRTSLLPMPLYNIITLSSDSNKYVGTKNGEALFEFGMKGIQARVEEAIVQCSRNTSLRRADFVIAELADLKELCSGNDAFCRIITSFCGNETIDIEIKF